MRWLTDWLQLRARGCETRRSSSLIWQIKVPLNRTIIALHRRHFSSSASYLKHSITILLNGPFTRNVELREPSLWAETQRMNCFPVVYCGWDDGSFVTFNKHTKVDQEGCKDFNTTTSTRDITVFSLVTASVYYTFSNLLVYPNFFVWKLQVQ